MLQLNPIFNDHMVFAFAKPIRVSGRSNEEVNVVFKGQKITATPINDEWEVDYVYTSESEMNSHVKNIPIGAFVLVYDPSASGASCNNVAHGAIEIGESNTNVKAAKVFCYAAPGTSADTPALVATY